jgi:DNA invertase Pin-like site-specific DNA recombinase
MFSSLKFLRKEGSQSGDIIIMTDVDEIPRKEVIQLFRLETILQSYSLTFVTHFPFILLLDVQCSLNT